MSTIKFRGILTILGIASILTGCSATNEVITPAQKGGSLVAVDLLIDTCGDKFYEFADQLNGDAYNALIKTAEWLGTQPEVLSATTLDSSMIEIELRSGIRAGFYLNLIGQDGLSEFRGGSGSGGKLKDLLGENSKYTIKNKKVMIFSPSDDFYHPGELGKFEAKIQAADLGLEVTTLQGTACTYSALNHFIDYGLVILETHGSPTAFKVGSTDLDLSKEFDEYPVVSEEEFATFIDKHEGAGTYAKLVSGELSFFGKVNLRHYQSDWTKFVERPHREIWVTTDYLATIPNMPNTIVFANMCYSGYTAAPRKGGTPIATAFMDKRPIAYFGYAKDDGTATMVSNDFAVAMDDSMTKSLMYDLDSTGNAHLTDAGLTQTDPFPRVVSWRSTLKQFGSPDYSYEKDCVDSVKDARDGQVYKTICLGGQVWMKQNLNYNYPGSAVYGGDLSNAATFGRMYSYEMLDSICPKGWHVPSEADWNTLGSTIGDPTGGKMKSTSTLWRDPNTGATNSSGFTALPGGSIVDIHDPANMSSGMGNIAIFATKSVDQGIWENQGILYDSETLDIFQSGSFNEGVSCRCVKDK